MSSSSSSSSVMYLRLSILLVLLTYPHASFEFSLKVSDGDATATTRRNPGKKFEFRKITRVFRDGGGDNDDVDEDCADGGGADDDDEDADEVRTERAAQKTAAASSGANENEELQFERVHKTEFAKTNPYARVSTPTTEALSERQEESKKQRESGRKQKQKPVKETSFFDFSSFFGGWFAGDSAKSASTVPQPTVPASADPSKSNGMIDWIQWILSKMSKSPVPPEEPPASSLVEVLSSYFNRWPFNTLFPIGKAEKPISMPRRGDSNAGYGLADLPPMSQEHFESLLHTLPGFVVNASHVADVECKQQMQVFHRQLRGNKLWTLQMLDSTGKITSGLLRGNINQFGDFDLCTQIRALVKVTSDIQMRFRGKYCLAHIETQTTVPELKVAVHLAHGRGLWNSHLGNPNHFVPRYSVANWGVCIPASCSAAVVKEMIETNLRPYNTTGVEFHVEVGEQDCYMRKSRRFFKILKNDTKLAASVFYFAVFVIIVVAAFLSDKWGAILAFINRCFNSRNNTDSEDTEKQTNEADVKDEKEESTIDAESHKGIDESVEEIPVDETSLRAVLSDIFRSFSPLRTLSELLSQDRSDMQFPVFHVLKIGSTLMLYICLKYLMIGHLPISNRDKLVRTVDQPLSIIFRSPMIYTDVLLLISGFLSAYSLSEEMEQRTYIGILKRIFAKVLRYLPTLYAVILFQTWILPYLGSGPLWSNLIDQNAKNCEQNMWRNLFSVQNAIDIEETCSPISIQLALEMQLFLLGPLIVWLYYTDSDAGFFVYGAIQAMSVAARFSRTNQEHLSTTLFHGMNISKFYRTANLLYSSPISRATPYLIGIGAGILHRSTDGSLEVAPAFVGVGWITAIVSIGWCFWYPSSGMRSDFIYNSTEAASYASWCPLIIGLAIVWIIFMLPNDDESIFKIIMTSRPIIFLSRISFPMQLVTFGVVIYTTASVRDTSKYNINDLINFGEIWIIMVCALIISFLIDVPFQNVRTIIVRRLFVESSSAEVEEPTSGGEIDQSEEISEGQSDHIQPDTPEPAESIWTSDPEDEENTDIKGRPSSAALSQDEAPSPEASETEDAEVEPEIISIQGEEETEEEDEVEISEDDEVMRRPTTPEAPSPTEDEDKPKATIRRRRQISADE